MRATLAFNGLNETACIEKIDLVQMKICFGVEIFTETMSIFSSVTINCLKLTIAFPTEQMAVLPQYNCQAFFIILKVIRMSFIHCNITKLSFLQTVNCFELLQEVGRVQSLFYYFTKITKS